MLSMHRPWTAPAGGVDQVRWYGYCAVDQKFPAEPTTAHFVLQSAACRRKDVSCHESEDCFGPELLENRAPGPATEVRVLSGAASR